MPTAIEPAPTAALRNAGAFALDDIVIRRVISTPPESSIGAVLQLMEERAISCVVVAEERVPVGIFTERDAVRLMAQRDALRERPIREVMSQPLVTVGTQLDFPQVYQMLTGGHFRHLVVVDDQQQLVGIVTESDFVEHVGGSFLIEEKSVAQVMNRQVITLPPESGLAEAVATMARANISCIIAAEGNRPVGVVTERDVVAFANAAMDLGQLTLRDVMSWPLHTVSRELPLQEAARRMQSAHVRRLVVVDDDGTLLGLLTRHDIVRALEGRYTAFLRETIEHQREALDRARDLLESAERQLLYRSVMDQIDDVVLVIEAGSGRIVEVNDRAGRATGFDREELIGMPIDAICTAIEGPQAWPEHARRYIAAGSLVLETEHRRKDGSRYPVEVSIRHVHSGGRALLVAVARDITERKRHQRALVERELQLRTLIEALPDAVFFKDGRGAWQVVNSQALQLFGLAGADWHGRTESELAAENPGMAQAHLACLASDEEAWAAGGSTLSEERLPQTGGGVRILEVTKVPLFRADGSRKGLVAVGRDVSERRLAEERLRQAAAVYESTAEGVMITDTEGAIAAVNRAFTDITGFSAEEVVGRNSSLLKSGRHDSAFFGAMWQAIVEGGAWQGEVWNRRKNGEIYPEWLTISTVRDTAGRVINYVGVFSDISLIKHSEAKLDHLAHYDPLTDLPNRLLLHSRLDHALERAHRHGRHLALLFLDIDRFKTVNDSLGHPSGDELLIAIAARLRARVRDEDTLARHGGDEFLVLMETLQRPEDAAALAEEILALLSQPFRLSGGQEVYASASIGISLYPNDGLDSTQLVRNADAALFQAKEAGGSTYRFYTGALTRAARERLSLETRLRRALEREEFILHFQPQIDLGTGRIVGTEALVRWISPDEGMVQPIRFIPISEETGLIVPVGEWVLHKACATAREWLDKGLPPITLAVNLSSRQFRERDLVQRIRAVLEETALPPSLLEVEITESMIMERGAHALAVMNELKDLGVSLAIDDFGTGYSSLASLKRFSVDKLKIDRSFVRDIPDDLSAMEIAATVIAMGRNLGLRVLAEGVETAAQLNFLRVQGCHEAQGFFWSQPVSNEIFVKLLAEHSLPGV